MGAAVALRSWFEDARRVPARAVAEELGLQRGYRKGEGRGPCPACGERWRGRGDKRGPLLVRDGWRCLRCNETGDGLALVALAEVGDKRPDASRWPEVRAWFAARGWCDPEPGSKPAPAVRRPVAPVVVPEAPKPSRLPAAEVGGLWGVTRRVDADASEPYQWLLARNLDPGEVADADLARVLPKGARPPQWATANGRSWAAGGWRLLLPCYDAAGDLAALRARFVGTGTPKLKEVSPRGSGALRGTVYADPVGRWILEMGANAKPGDRVTSRGQPDLNKDPPLYWDGRVLIVEGGPAFLTYGVDPTRWRLNGEKLSTHAVFGVWSGAWPAGPDGAELAGRLAGADLVALATDDDDDGDRYADGIATALEAAGVKVGRTNKRSRNG